MKHVALLIETRGHVYRQILIGIAAFARAGGGERWRIYSEPVWGAPQVGQLKQWCGDGLIAQANPPALAAELRQLALRLPVVNVAEFLPDDRVQLPSVYSEGRAVGAMGATYLLERGLRRLAFVEQSHFALSTRRREGFVAAARGLPRVDVADIDALEPAALVTWVAGLSKPVGVMAATDGAAFRVTEAAAAAGLRVPDEVAVVGVGNDPVICELVHPPLTSIDLGAEQVGYQAAALLARLMNGGAAPDAPVRVPPRGIVERGSADVTRLGDPVLDAAVRFIRDHADKPIGVDDVADAVAVGRRLLERRFRAVLGHSPLEQVRLVRLRRARELLAGGDLRVTEVATAAGFGDFRQMAAVFRKHLGVTPSDFRIAARGRGM